MSHIMYCEKFMSNYNYKVYQYIKLIRIIGGPYLLRIFSKILLLIFIHVVGNQKIDMNYLQYISLSLNYQFINCIHLVAELFFFANFISFLFIKLVFSIYILYCIDSKEN